MSLSVISPGNGLRLLSFGQFWECLGPACLTFGSSLDGGGIRSISQALMVKEMMHRVQEDHQLPEPPKVSDYFDMICGSGFGGLLAIMCGILHMTGDQLVQEFIRLCKILFSGKLQTIAERTDRFENEIRKLVANYCSGEEEKKMISEESTCKTFVCAASSHNAGHPYIFRNYRSRSNPSPDCTIWEASRATTAMPDFFRPIVIRDKNVSQTFVGGMVRWSNPTDVLTKEAARLFGNRHVACIISIGSGHSGHISLAVGITNMFIAIALDCEQRADELSYRFAHVPYVFMRFSVGQGLQNLKGDLSNLDKVIAHTHSYLQGTCTSRDVDVLLNALVHRPDRILVQQISGSVASAPQIGSPKICPQPTQYFTGRLTTIKRLEEYFVSNEDSCRVAVLYGIGGSGKTQIGLEFIQRNKSRFSDVYFIDASSKFTLESDLVSIASEDSNQPSFPAAMQILRGRKKEWLLFLDNADDPSLNLRPYISWPHGNVLITTRNPEIQTHAPKCSISVDRLSPEDATKLLLRSIPTSPGSDEQKVASEIVQILGCLALAINQARAFLSKGTCSLREYLSLYKQNRKLLLEERLVQKSDDYRYSVYTTWTISFRQVSPDAALLFQLFSFMHYEAIPASLFNDAWRLLKKYNNAIPPILFKFLSGCTDSNSTWNMLRFRNLIGELLSFSLIEFHVSQNTVSLHPLVQQWAQDHCRDREDIVRCTQTSVANGLAEAGLRAKPSRVQSHWLAAVAVRLVDGSNLLSSRSQQPRAQMT
ncbi:acyl transferase/acyl hydrolase/lysophospholipase [Flagelloscypha sp. PMI_526]|nr:acyl transferase/acyl hydrolase/lysophospholipase [Flagelloscypha sp. PMI_526]